MTEVLKLVEAGQGDFELQGRPTVSAREWNQDAGIEPFLSCGVELLMHGLKRALPVRGRDVIGKAGEVHGSSSGIVSLVNPAPTPVVRCPAKTLPTSWAPGFPRSNSSPSP